MDDPFIREHIEGVTRFVEIIINNVLFIRIITEHPYSSSD